MDFYRVLRSFIKFTQFYLGLTSFTGFKKVLPSLSDFYLFSFSFIYFCPVLTEFY